MSGSTQPSSLLANRALQGALNPTTTGPGSSRPVNGTVVGNSRGKRERDGDDVPMRDGGGGGPSRSGRGATGGARRGAIGSGQTSRHNPLSSASRPIASRISSAPSSSNPSNPPVLPPRSAKRTRTSAIPSDHKTSDRSGRSGEGDSKTKVPEFVGVLKTVLQARFRAKGVLDLSNLQAEPILIEKSIFPPGHPEASTFIGEVIWKIVRELDPYTHSISLANNKLDSLRHLQKLPLFLPHVEELDLSGNAGLVDPVHINTIAGKPYNASSREGGLKDLKRLTLVGTGIRDKLLRDSSPKTLEAYFSTVLSWFPNLGILDGLPVPRLTFPVLTNQELKPVPKAQLEALKNADYVWPANVGEGNLGGDVVRGVTEAFMAKFFNLFDENRAELVYAYSPGSTLSLHTSGFINPRSRFSNIRAALPKQNSLTWDQYSKIQYNRNVLRIPPSKRGSSLLIVKDEQTLKKYLDDLPMSKHDLADPKKWMFDAMEMPGDNTKIILVVHGEFQEAPSQALRSFTRTFVLQAAIPESLAAQKGWQVCILSDTYSLRNYSVPESLRFDLAVGGAKLAAPVVEPSQITPEQQQMIQQLSQATRLTATGSETCLAAAGWNLQNALTIFETERANIPPEWFIPA